MKIYNKVILLILIAVLLCTNNVFIFAHDQMLDVEYESCGVPRDPYGQIERMDGEDELWYWLIDGYCEFHISNEVQTIKYYFADDAKGSDTYTWTTDLTETEALEIKNAYANSMKKWDNIYYYSYDENGNRIANKIINVVEGTLTDHNLIIYPTHNKTFSAQTFYSDNNAPCLEMNDKQIGHFHYEHWWMEVNIDVLKEGYPSYNVYRERTGEHELGHVLGIFDVDEHCTYSSEMQHHEELLMGYGYGDRSTYARYKDIAGVAITRGFHTDADHVWMLRVNTDGTKDVICTLCNGVRYNITLTIDNNNNCYYENKPFNMYKSCVHHGGTNEEMLLVATDGERNFFKCQYCRHIQEVEISNYSVATKYVGASYSNSILVNQAQYHKLVLSHNEIYTFKSSVINGLDIELCDSNLNSTNKLTSDIFTVDGCNITLDAGTYYLRIRNTSFADISFNISITPPPHTHEYKEWKYYSTTKHISCCECGECGTTIAYHVAKAENIGFGKGICLYCGAILNLLTDDFPSLMSIVQYSINGSYILPTGIIVLVDEDIEAYENGTLVFYDKDDLPVIQ